MRKLLSIIASTTLILAGCENKSQESIQNKAISADITAPSIAYDPLRVSNNEAGPFSIIYQDTVTLLSYQARSGTMNLMGSILENPELTGYVAINKAYSFGAHRYVLVVSTGELGVSCPARTYVLSFDTKQESVDGYSEIEGCSEVVESLSEGNKLTIKKDGKATIVYNGIAK